ncbi:MAG TPA: glycosyltransferase family 2 protein [Thermodesulfobacteriota bacterium]
MRDRPALSVVIPVLDEADNVGPLHRRLREALEPMGVPFEILFVDDGSRDGTPERLAALRAADPAVVVVRFRRNFGQTAAMAAGFRLARGRIIVSLDGDLQNDPADIPRLVAKLDEGYDVVQGWRRNRQDRFLSRRLPSIVANRLIARLSGVSVHDNGCSLKAYRAEVIKRVALYAEMHRFIPAMATLAGARIAEVPVRHHARRFGRSKYGIGRAWRVCLDLFLVAMLTRFAARPGLWFGLWSLAAAAAGLACVGALLLPLDSGIVLPSLAFLAFCLAGHLLAMGAMGTVLVETGSFRPDPVAPGVGPRTVRLPIATKGVP